MQPSIPAMNWWFACRRFGRHMAAVLMLVLLGQDAIAEVESTILTLDGVAYPVRSEPARTRRQLGTAEGGQAVVVDDYAVIRQDANGPSIVSSTDAFAADGDSVRIAASQLSAAPSSSSKMPAALDSNQRPLRASLGLLIYHQRTHDPGHGFTPPPNVDFQPQRLSTGDADGQRGFAVLSVGETGRVRRVKLLVDGQPTRNPQLQSALAAGLKSSFQDARRHDYTVYMAYAVQDQLISLTGEPIVTLPMCCDPPCGGRCP